MKAGNYCWPSVTWEMHDDTLVLSGSDHTYNYSVTIDSSIVYENGDTILYGCKTIEIWRDIESSVKHIAVKEAVRILGSCIFAGFSELESVTISSGLESILTDAFRYCFKLKTVTISQNLSGIWPSAFSHCPNLNSIVLPNTVIRIDSLAFSKNYSLTDFTIRNPTPPVINTLAFKDVDTKKVAL